MKISGELDYRIRYDVEHDLFHAQNIFNDEYIKPTFIEYVQKLEKENAELENDYKLIDKSREHLVQEKYNLEYKIENLENKIEHHQEVINTLQKKNAELSEKLSEQKQYTAFKCNEFVKKKEVYEREHFLLTKAKEIIKKLKALYFSPVVTKDDVKRQDEILAEAEQILNSEPQSKWINPARTTNDNEIKIK